MKTLVKIEPSRLKQLLFRATRRIYEEREGIREKHRQIRAKSWYKRIGYDKLSKSYELRCTNDILNEIQVLKAVLNESDIYIDAETLAVLVMYEDYYLDDMLTKAKDSVNT